MGSLADPLTDVLIIGGGPAALSAALSIYRFQHTIKIFDFSRNAPHYENPTRLTPGFEGKTLNEIRAICRAELDGSGLVSYEDVLVTNVEKTDDGNFEVEGKDGRKWRGKTLMIATGAHDIMLDIEVYKECFAKTILPCVFTFGYERRNSPIPTAALLGHGMLAMPPIAAILIADTLKFAPSVTFYTDGPQPDLAAALTAQFPADQLRIDARKISSVSPKDTSDVHKGVVLHFAEGEPALERFIVHKPLVAVDLPFAKNLGLKMAPSGEIEVSPPSNRTSVEKVYAAGDCAGQARCVSNAFLMGACVATGIVRDIGPNAPGGMRGGEREEAAAKDQVELKKLRAADEACQRSNVVLPLR